jgi:hypothetical protein
MIKFFKLFFLVFVSILITNCDKKQSDLEFEKEVMYQVFAEVLDSVYRDRHLIHPPPPIKFPKELRKYNEELAEYKKDKSKKIVIIDDNVRGFFIDNKLKKTLTDFKISIDSLTITKSYKFDISKIDTKKFDFKYRSSFPEIDYLIWENKKYKYKLSGEIYVSRIIFDNFKEKGFFTCGYICGEKAGEGFEVFIKNHNGKWIIDKIENTWIS